MSRTATIIISILVALIIAVGIKDFYDNYEEKEKVVHLGHKGEARSNPLYATRLFLKRMGIPAETKTSIQGLGKLPSTNTVLLLSTKRTTLSRAKTKELIEWVKSGGHLITTATKDWSYNGSSKNDEVSDEDTDKSEDQSPDPLQRFMGVHTGSRDYAEEEIPEGLESLIESFIDEDLSDNAKLITLKGADKDLLLDHKWWYRSIYVDEAHRAQTEEIPLYGTNFMVRQTIGNGLITLVSDLKFITNKKLEKADHAEILWHLVKGLHKPTNLPANVWLIHNDKMPSLWTLLWKNAWTFILSLGILFLAWLLFSTRRFGPVIPKEEENRRSIMEHVSSSGNFYWKNKKQQKLIDGSRQALTTRLTQVNPGWSQRTDEEKVKYLAEQASVKPEIIQQVLFAYNIELAEDFTQLIKQIEHIRQKI